MGKLRASRADSNPETVLLLSAQSVESRVSQSSLSRVVSCSEDMVAIHWNNSEDEMRCNEVQSIRTKIVYESYEWHFLSSYTYL